MKSGAYWIGNRPSPISASGLASSTAAFRSASSALTPAARSGESGVFRRDCPQDPEKLRPSERAADRSSTICPGGGSSQPLSFDRDRSDAERRVLLVEHRRPVGLNVAEPPVRVLAICRLDRPLEPAGRRLLDVRKIADHDRDRHADHGQDGLPPRDPRRPGGMRLRIHHRPRSDPNSGTPGSPKFSR